MPHPVIVHTSNPEAGGAETSLLAALAETGNKPIFLVPAEGSLSRAIASRGWAFRILPWPAGMQRLTQSRWYALPLVSPGLLTYLFRLRRECRGAGTVWSSGVKSHAACLLLSPWLRARLLFDIRDFLRPMELRKAIAWVARRFGCRIRTNSKAVAGDFPGARIQYPRVELPRAPVDRRPRGPGYGRFPAETPRRETSDGKVSGGKRIVAHLAYFAPYKGQDLFLECARKLLDAGVDAEFWIIGDVIYPAQIYDRYRERIYGLAGNLRLTSHVRFLGRLEGGDKVQEALEQAHLLLHCTREPEPFGRAVMEALMCGSEAICHRGSGVVEVTGVEPGWPEWMKPLREVLGPEYVRVGLKRVGKEENERPTTY